MSAVFTHDRDCPVAIGCCPVGADGTCYLHSDPPCHCDRFRCQQCNGDGVFTYWMGHDDERETECPFCNGTGEVDTEQAEQLWCHHTTYRGRTPSHECGWSRSCSRCGGDDL